MTIEIPSLNYHIANIISCDGKYLSVESIFPQSDFERGGKKHGYKRNWQVNHYSFTGCPKETKLAYNLTENKNSIEPHFLF